MTSIFRFFSRNYLDRLPREDREMIERNAVAAAARSRARGDNAPSEVQIIRNRRRAAAQGRAAT